jgi:riboflavin kinase / FMN adenylyltransferase
MKVYRDINSLPVFTNAVITTGSFDGVHVGHVQIIEQLIKEAAKIGGTPVLITFYPHPKQVVQMKEKVLYILNTPEEKYELLQLKGIENIVVVPFDKEFSELSAQEYISNFLVAKFHPSIIVVGYDHRFGNNREGNFDLLKSKEAEYNFEVKEIPEHVLTDITISSTKIRAAMLAGDIEKAASYLGYHYYFSGKVIQGNKIGRTIGYPTANLQIEDKYKLVPANGVYAVDVQLGSRYLKGMMNIGIRPTVDGTKRVIEVNIFNFDEDIYGETLKIILKINLRLEVKFSSLEALKTQLAKDKQHAVLVNGE